MKKRYNILMVFAIPIAFLFLTSEVWFHSGSPGGKSGSPGDGGNNCTDCHAGTPVNEELWIYGPDLLVGGYSAGQTYDLFVLGIDANAVKMGFEATAEDQMGNKVGTFEAGFGGFNQAINNGQAITHTALGSTPLSDTASAWFFSWTAPATNVGNITFYAAINTANGNGQTSGDVIHLANFIASPSVGINDQASTEQLHVYPNPSNGLITVSNKANNEGLLEILNLNGQLVYSQEVSGSEVKADLSSIGNGIYIARLGEYSQRFVIR